jgi:hypothetical protein
MTGVAIAVVTTKKPTTARAIIARLVWIIVVLLAPGLTDGQPKRAGAVGSGPAIDLK